MPDHACKLDDVAELHLSPLAASVGLAQRGDKRSSLGSQPLAGLVQPAQLGLETTARLAPLLIEAEQLGVYASQLLLERRQQLLDGVLAFVEVTLGLRLRRLQLRTGHLSQLGHACLQRLRAERLERRREALLCVVDS